MTQDEIIEMAKQAGCGPTLLNHWRFQLEAFAKLIAEKERTWAGLTDEEVDKILSVYEQDYNWTSFSKAIEAKLKDKNG